MLPPEAFPLRTRVMDYINRLESYDGPEIAKIALESALRQRECTSREGEAGACVEGSADGADHSCPGE